MTRITNKFIKNQIIIQNDQNNDQIELNKQDD